MEVRGQLLRIGSLSTWVLVVRSYQAYTASAFTYRAIVLACTLGGDSDLTVAFESELCRWQCHVLRSKGWRSIVISPARGAGRQWRGMNSEVNSFWYLSRAVSLGHCSRLRGSLAWGKVIPAHTGDCRMDIHVLFLLVGHERVTVAWRCR